jgi:glycine C-acetyltransferase
MASVRFICGTQTQHKRPGSGRSATSSAPTRSSSRACFDANGGVFEVLFGESDAIISDELNHASLIDGIRLAKARRYRYRNADMADLRAQLDAARDAGRGDLRRHRRRLLDGRVLRAAGRDLRPGG